MADPYCEDEAPGDRIGRANEGMRHQHTNR